jgi:hypothetical protein
MTDKYTRPDGFCRRCGQPWWTEEHNHKTLGTLTPEAALNAWQNKLAQEQADAARAEEHATVPRQ